MNSKVKHSPGQWVAECVGSGGSYGDPVDLWEIHNGYRRICEFVTTDDARLIAKAPALAEALAWALDELEADGDSLDPDFRAALEAARQTLNEALGA